MRPIRFLSFVATILAGPAVADQVPQTPVPRAAASLRMAQGGGCKAADSCREAVIMWCGGYRRADADGDGIPCENVCRSRPQVDAIRQEIGC